MKTRRFIKAFAFSLILLMTSFITVEAKNPTCTISGESSGYADHFYFIEVHVNGDNMNNIKGTITYDAKTVALYKTTPNEALNYWDIRLDTPKEGTITFDATLKEDAIETSNITDDTILFYGQFVIHNAAASSATFKTSGVTTEVVTVETDKSIVENQADIDEANKFNEENKDAIAAGEMTKKEVPAPVYGTKEVPSTVKAKDSSFKIKVDKKASDNAYLKGVTVVDGTLDPAFNKLTNNYRLVYSGKDQTIQLTPVAEYPSSTVEISEEANEQIIVTVTSETGDVNSYLFNITRDAEVIEPGHNNSGNPKTDPGKKSSIFNLNITDSKILILLVGVIVISLGIIGIGGYYVYVGSHEEVED